ncbi:YitT family protein, partial [Phocaeicola vulgatus]|uniref:YitT family protein n=1 Tax=Phocaeicola vulgatus TaxID=821 RepID=UPI002109916B
NDWKRVLFGFCLFFIMSIVIDYVINSSRQSVQFLIFSRKHDEIDEGINKQIDRGVTLLDCTGWYSKQGIKV